MPKEAVPDPEAEQVVMAVAAALNAEVHYPVYTDGGTEGRIVRPLKDTWNLELRDSPVRRVVTISPNSNRVEVTAFDSRGFYNRLGMSQAEHELYQTLDIVPGRVTFSRREEGQVRELTVTREGDVSLSLRPLVEEAVRV